jgi:hypothetical protein
MNIAKALKVKNRLTGQIAKQYEIIKRENSRRNDNTSTVNVEAEVAKLAELQDELITLKAKISTASIPVFEKVIELKEVKGLVNFLKALSVREGVEKIAYGQNTVIDYTWTAYINAEKRDSKVTELEKQINDLQDEIDNFNAVTSV